MWSSSTASTTAPRAPARSLSRIRAACSSAAAAARSDTSRWRDIWRRTVRNSPVPRTTRTSTSTPAYQAVSWSRRRASGSITDRSRAEAVAGPAQRRDQLLIEPVVDLAPQPPHQHLEDVDERVVVVVPDVRRDRRPVEHASRMQHEQLEQSELLRRQGDRPAAAPHLAGGEIDFQVRDAMPGRGERRPPAGQRLEPRQQLTESEGLGEGAIRAHLETPRAVAPRVRPPPHQARGRPPPGAAPGARVR